MSSVRARIEHCSILHDEQIARMRDLGVSASFLIGHVHFWGLAMRDTVFGEAKAQLLDRCKACEEAGLLLNVTAGQTIRIMPPLNVTREEVDEAVEILGKALKEQEAAE